MVLSYVSSQTKIINKKVHQCTAQSAVDHLLYTSEVGSIHPEAPRVEEVQSSSSCFPRVYPRAAAKAQKGDIIVHDQGNAEFCLQVGLNDLESYARKGADEFRLRLPPVYTELPEKQ